MPRFVIDYTSLAAIPRSHPEELNDITLWDRLNKLEKKLTSLQITVDSNMAENYVLWEKVGPDGLHACRSHTVFLDWNFRVEVSFCVEGVFRMVVFTSLKGL